MCKNSLFIPQSVKSKHSFLICFEIAKELSEFRNYLCITYEFYIIQQLVRDKSIKKYIDKNKGNIDSTLICMHKLEQEANMGEIKYER